MNLVLTDFVRSHSDGHFPNTLSPRADTLGIRPDSLLLAEPAEPSTPLPAVLELFEPAGDVSHLYLRLENLPDPLTARVQGRPNLAEGAPLTLHVRHAEFHPFERETGRRVAGAS